MTLRELVEKADKGYRKGFSDADGGNCLSSLLDFVDKNGRPRWGVSGDTLALFIVHELHETFDQDADDDTQLARAREVLTQAVSELEATITALDD